MTTQMTTSSPSITVIDFGSDESAYVALAAEGFQSATAFADSHPVASLASLAEALKEPTLSALQLERLLVNEAEAAGTLPRCARSLLARDLRNTLPQGWPHQSAEESDALSASLFLLDGVFQSLVMALPESCESGIARIRRAMESELDIPAGWLPAGADDALLCAIFAEHW